jgi:hypothetical protein
MCAVIPNTHPLNQSISHPPSRCHASCLFASCPPPSSSSSQPIDPTRHSQPLYPLNTRSLTLLTLRADTPLSPLCLPMILASLINLLRRQPDSPSIPSNQPQIRYACTSPRHNIFAARRRTRGYRLEMVRGRTLTYSCINSA